VNGGAGHRVPRAAVAASVLILAVVLGVVVAMLVRPDGPVGGPATPVGTAGPVGSYPSAVTESPDPAPPGPFAEVSRRVGSGAHRVVATTCTGTGIGTAYQFGTEGLLVTAVRSVSGARGIAIASGDRLIPAEVAKIDTRSGLALLKPATRLSGHTFVLGTRQLAVGDEVAAVGWTAQARQPVGGRLRITVGKVTETGVTLPSPDGNHSVRRMAGEFDPGLAGAPVVDADGLLLGMLVQGDPDQRELYVAGIDTIADPLLGPTGRPPAIEPCLSSAGPAVATTVGGSAEPATRTALGMWYSALNSGDWDRARGVLADGLQQEWTRDRLVREYAETYQFNLEAATTGATTTVTWARLGSGRACVRGTTDFQLDQGRITAMIPRGESQPCG
jgi:hypothetical protein